MTMRSYIVQYTHDLLIDHDARYNDVKIGSTKVVYDNCYPEFREKFTIPARRDEMNELRVEVSHRHFSFFLKCARYLSLVGSRESSSKVPVRNYQFD